MTIARVAVFAPTVAVLAELCAVENACPAGKTFNPDTAGTGGTCGDTQAFCADIANRETCQLPAFETMSSDHCTQVQLMLDMGMGCCTGEAAATGLLACDPCADMTNYDGAKVNSDDGSTCTQNFEFCGANLAQCNQLSGTDLPETCAGLQQMMTFAGCCTSTSPDLSSCDPCSDMTHYDPARISPDPSEPGACGEIFEYCAGDMAGCNQQAGTTGVLGEDCAGLQAMVAGNGCCDAPMTDEQMESQTGGDGDAHDHDDHDHDDEEGSAHGISASALLFLGLLALRV